MVVTRVALRRNGGDARSSIIDVTHGSLKDAFHFHWVFTSTGEKGGQSERVCLVTDFSHPGRVTHSDAHTLRSVELAGNWPNLAELGMHSSARLCLHSFRRWHSFPFRPVISFLFYLTN